jgi:hypothetical protein
VSPNAEALAAFEGFELALKQVLPGEIGFRRIKIEMPEVVLETDTGRFPLESSSGGIGAIIDLVWQIYIFTLTAPGRQFTLLIDEPENHLHPSLQRELLPSLTKAFPLAQIIVTTHSPFIVSAEPSASVYTLEFARDPDAPLADTRRAVVAHSLNAVDRNGTANEVLRSALGVEVTSPIWVERSLEQIEQAIASSGHEIDMATIEQIRVQLEAIGLDEYFPQLLASVIERKNR